MSTSETDAIGKIINLKEEIKKLKNNASEEYNRKKNSLSQYRLIRNFRGINLYQDRIVTGEKEIALDSNVQAAVEADGQISYTPEVKGGGQRPTLTRMAVGGAIAGPLGAVIGMAAQKKKKIRTVTHEHDDREVTLTIVSNDGVICRTWSGEGPAEARQFVAQIQDAIISYPEVKKRVESERRETIAELKKLENENPSVRQEKELDSLMKKLTDEQNSYLKKTETQITVALVLGIVGLLLSYWPIIGLVIPIVTIVLALKIKKRGIKTKKSDIAFILGVIGVCLSALVLLLIVFAPKDVIRDPQAGNQEKNDSGIANDIKEDEDEDVEDAATQKQETSSDSDEYLGYLRKCTVMEAYDLYTYGTSSGGNVFDEAKVTCEGNYNNWGANDFYEAVRIDWDNEKSEEIDGHNLEYYLDNLGW